MTKFKSKKVRSLPADVSTWVFVFQGFLYVPVLTLILRLRLCLPCLTSSEYSCTPFIVDVDTDDTARIQLARSWTRPAWARHYMWSFQQTCITCIDLYDLYFVRGFIWFCFPGKSWLPWSFEIGRIEQWLGHARAKFKNLGVQELAISSQFCQPIFFGFRHGRWEISPSICGWKSGPCSSSWCTTSCRKARPKSCSKRLFRSHGPMIRLRLGSA